MPEPGTSGRNVHVLFDVLSSTVCLFIAFATTDYYYHDFASHRAVDFYAAGVLPVAYDPTTARAYMLLGYDGFRSSWADFSGRREFDEIESTRTACRELIEETGGVIADMASEDACLRLLDETHVTTSTLYSESRPLFTTWLRSSLMPAFRYGSLVIEARLRTRRIASSWKRRKWLGSTLMNSTPR